MWTKEIQTDPVVVYVRETHNKINEQQASYTDSMMMALSSIVYKLHYIGHHRLGLPNLH